jgi:hypothetical protein
MDQRTCMQGMYQGPAIVLLLCAVGNVQQLNPKFGQRGFTSPSHLLSALAPTQALRVLTCRPGTQVHNIPQTELIATVNLYKQEYLLYKPVRCWASISRCCSPKAKQWQSICLCADFNENHSIPSSTPTSSLLFSRTVEQAEPSRFAETPCSSLSSTSAQSADWCLLQFS